MFPSPLDQMLVRLGEGWGVQYFKYCLLAQCGDAFKRIKRDRNQLFTQGYLLNNWPLVESFLTKETTCLQAVTRTKLDKCTCSTGQLIFNKSVLSGTGLC